MSWSTNKCFELNEKNPLEDFLGICENLKLGREPRNVNSSSSFFCMEGIFYRGEPEIFKESLLIPKIFRKEHLDIEEAELISDFKSTFPEHEKNLSSDIDWLSYMQHQGLPTRLLDWSTDPLVALYFALGQDPNDLEDQGVVYIVPIINRIQYLEPYESPIRLVARYYSNIYAKFAQAGLFEEIKRLKEKTIPPEYHQHGALLDIQDHVINGVYRLDSHGNKINLTDELYRDAVEVFPPNSHARIKAQSGVFTIHYGKYLNRQKILCDEPKHQQSYFVRESYKIIIPNKVKPMLKKKLEVLGISEFKLFPEADKFYSYFRKKKKKFQPLSFFEIIDERIIPVTDPRLVRYYLLKLPYFLNTVAVPIPHIIKLFKLLGIERVIDEIVKKFLCSSFKETNLFVFPHLYRALDEFCKTDKTNQKLVIIQLAKLERKTKLLSKMSEICNHKGFYGGYFNLQDNLFHKALKSLEKKPITSPHDSVEVNQETTETTLEKS